MGRRGGGGGVGGGGLTGQEVDFMLFRCVELGMHR